MAYESPLGFRRILYWLVCSVPTPSWSNDYCGSFSDRDAVQFTHLGRVSLANESCNNSAHVLLHLSPRRLVVEHGARNRKHRLKRAMAVGQFWSNWMAITVWLGGFRLGSRSDRVRRYSRSLAISDHQPVARTTRKTQATPLMETFNRV